MIKQSNGWIWMYSELGKGTTFKIYLPKGVSGEPSTIAEPALTSEGTRSFYGSETVILAEDQADVRKLVAGALEQYGYRVLEVASGEEALSFCASVEDEIHLLVTDVVMPGISGPELAHRIAASRPTMKVLYMSGYTENLIAHQGVLDAGVAYLPKPFTAGALARMVREVLDQRNG